jgi:2-oxoglutarate/2-oxoacid ferredoxin oxidoreductase subunit beta
MAVASGYTFVARSYALDVRHLKQTLRAAIEHRGSAFVDVLQTCPTYNDINTKEWYGGEDLPVKAPRLYKLEDSGYNGSVADPSTDEVNTKKGNALLKSFEWGDKIPIGVFFKMEVPTFEDQLALRMPALKDKPFVEQDIYNRDITPLLDELI